MGCFNSKPSDAGAIRRRPGNIGEVAVFIPGLRVPESLELSQPLSDGHPRRLTERLAALRSRIVVMAAREALSVTRPRKRTFTQHGGSTSADLLQALEDYLPVLLGLVKEDNKRASVEIFLKASGFLECAIQHVLPRISPENSPKATLAVKRRLACEMVKCWQQAHESMADLPLIDSWGEKHRLFVMWKYIEAKAAAYYYHGLILDEGNTEKSHRMAVAALQSAEEFLKESKDAAEAFHAAPPVSRSPPACGSMKYLHEKIQKDSSCKVRINKDLYSNDSIREAVPALPDFSVALKPEEYRLPAVTVGAAND
ncbi:hypothetical protein SORBI_3004G354200 [Sorghum bicolor]|uniref:BRO1 domain-containing protein n=1 Tax=Sorghum bicolor TaxID=4558 RepID=A0A1Z5RQF1_SORBI|nr:hypothetical protein SORBI_3004G354200 [Sorghum bicolor]